MKISDEISLSARNLLRRKGRTALTLVGVVIGTCMVVLMISLGIAQNQANDEMIQSWGDLTQIEIYGGGISVGSDGKAIKLDDAALTQIRELNNVLAATLLISGMSGGTVLPAPSQGLLAALGTGCMAAGLLLMIIWWRRRAPYSFLSDCRKSPDYL